MLPQWWTPNTVSLLVCGRVYQIYVIPTGSCNTAHQTLSTLSAGWLVLFHLILFCFGVGDLAHAKQTPYPSALSPDQTTLKAALGSHADLLTQEEKKYLQPFCGLSLWSSFKPKGAVGGGNTEGVWLWLLWLTTFVSSLGPALPMLSRFQVCWSISVTGPKCTNFCLGLEAFL